MRIEYIGNGRWKATIRHANGTSELSGPDRDDVIQAAIQIRYEYVNGI